MHQVRSWYFSALHWLEPHCWISDVSVPTAALVKTLSAHGFRVGTRPSVWTEMLQRWYLLRSIWNISSLAPASEVSRDYAEKLKQTRQRHSWVSLTRTQVRTHQKCLEDQLVWMTEFFFLCWPDEGNSSGGRWRSMSKSTITRSTINTLLQDEHHG